VEVVAMTATMTVRQVHRPVAERVLLAVLLFLGVTASIGGAALLVAPAVGREEWFPDDLLDQLPLVDSWVVPGLVLGVCFGAGSLLTWWGMWRRPDWGWTRWAQRLTGLHWSWLATVVLGAGHAVWIGLELASIEFSWFHVLYGAVALVLLLLPLTRAVRADLAVAPG
jgi:hypothetical protein